MAKLHDEVIKWTPATGRVEAKTRVQVFDDLVFIGRKIVMLTEPIDNTGMSVTNGIEHVCERAIRKFNLNVASTTFIEHYPYEDDEETFDVVTFESVRAPFIRPTWHRLEWSVVRNSIADRPVKSWKEL